MGGNGKTPETEEAVDGLRHQFRQHRYFDVVRRGEGRQTDGVKKFKKKKKCAGAA